MTQAGLVREGSKCNNTSSPWKNKGGGGGDRESTLRASSLGSFLVACMPLQQEWGKQKKGGGRLYVETPLPWHLQFKDLKVRGWQRRSA